MASFNKVILLGNLTRDPQLSYLPSGTAVCEIGLAVNNRYTGADGQVRENVCFIDARCFGRQAEVLNQYMSKGRPLMIEGRLDLDQWETPDGQKRSKHRVFIQNFQFVGGAQGGAGGQGGGDHEGDAQGHGSGGGQGNAPRGGGQGRQGGYGNAPRGGGQGRQGGYGNAPQAPPPEQDYGPIDEPGSEDIPF